jgi:dTDP-4-dehydrorhamnose 3,5-epimerase
MNNKSLSDIKENIIDANQDFRGEIFTTYKDSFSGLSFQHDKITIRYKDVLVGIHGDDKTWKLVTCLYGRVFAVFVDNRKDSIDYLKHKEIILSSENKRQILLPPGIGNSFFVLSDVCVYNYKLSYTGNYIDHDEQFTLKWNDPKLNIHWPHNNPILSKRDS